MYRNSPDRKVGFSGISALIPTEAVWLIPVFTSLSGWFIVWAVQKAYTSSGEIVNIEIDDLFGPDTILLWTLGVC